MTPCDGCFQRIDGAIAGFLYVLHVYATVQRNSIQLPAQLDDALMAYVHDGQFKDKSEAFRYFLRRGMMRERAISALADADVPLVPEVRSDGGDENGSA